MTVCMSTMRIALYSVDPPGLSSFHTFDPESFALIPAINDALVFIDAEGGVQPALATAWRRLSPSVMEFDLREGVRFHDGQPFDADDVVATFDAHRAPTPSASGSAIFSNIRSVQKIGPMRVRVETVVPDAMLLHRMFFGGIYPRRVLEREGRDYFASHPIGTGAYEFVRYDRGREIVLRRNPLHWAKAATVEEIRLPILRQKEWVDRLARGDLDAAWNLDSHDRVRAARLPGIVARSRPAAISQWFLLSNKGPLADERVRQALNHAIQRRLLVELSEHGLGAPQRGVCTPEQEGYVELEPYRYSPDLARAMLAEAGYPEGFTLRGLVSETSTGVYFAVREFLARVGVTLEAEVVPRSTWMQTMTGRSFGGPPYEGDFAVASIDNPLLHGLFHQFIFLFSQGPCSLTRDAGYDQAFLAAATNTGEPTGAPAALERYARDHALLLFTVQQQVHAAWREGVQCVLPRSGHFDAAAFWNLRCDAPVRRASLPPSPPPLHIDVGHLLDATSHTGTFFLRPDVALTEPTVQRIWRNVADAEARWRVQNEPMLHELVSAVEARTSLANVLGSTDRVAIVGLSPEGRQLFANRGYVQMIGEGVDLIALLGRGGEHGWEAIERAVTRDGSWVGPVALAPEGRPPGAPCKLFLTVTTARDEDGAVLGRTFVLTDLSGEEERIRHAAIRTILDHVPYGLFVLDRDGRMAEGYSESCRRIFHDAAVGSLVGRDIAGLLRLDARAEAHFRSCFEQVIDDLMPPEVSLGQLPEKVTLGPRTFSLRGAVVRDGDGAVTGVLFTLLDISDLVAAEQEAERHRATVLVLRFRASFEGYVRELDRALGDLAEGPGDASEARAALHTAKGVFGQFALRELASHIHQMEDDDEVTPDALRALRARVREAVHARRDVWGIDLDDADPTYAVQESTLRALERLVARTRDPSALRAGLAGMVSTLREKTAGELLGPIAQAGMELAARRGKSVRVVVEGDDVRVPARHAAALGTLVHLVRNAVDHGVEGPDERGDKPAEATVRIAITRGADALVVEVEDDGRGVDLPRVVEKALACGVVDAPTLAAMDEPARLRLVFAEGLSTAEVVSETSGRGVGSGAVRAAVEAAGGDVQVRSVAGAGTRFVLTLPLAVRASLLAPSLSEAPSAMA